MRRFVRWFGTVAPYDVQAVERAQQALWAAPGAHAAVVSAKPKRYVLAMFPYPSGALHMGHVRVYTLSDTVARFERLRGFSVLHPMGWDSFGLPAENAARDRGVDPREWTRNNIAQMREQLRALGLSFDWSREVSTCEPAYYGGTQELFCELYRRGLVYRRHATVNWDPVDQTVLANEQVDAQGRSWRSGAPVEQRSLEQWFVRITAYRDALLAGLDALPGWPDTVKKMQRQWIDKPLHDWLISRQRPWGTPIPIVHCAVCGPVLDTALPVTQSGTVCACPACARPDARREQDTMDTFVDSAWYYLRYAADAPQHWMPVDVYVGGIEHAVMHLLYARFVGLVLTGREPFVRLLVQGMVQNRTWRAVGSALPVRAADVDPVTHALRADPTQRVEATWEKMSKSKFNGVEPGALLARYGADATRLFVLFRAPPTMALEWDESGVLGMARWLQRIWQLCNDEGADEATGNATVDAVGNADVRSGDALAASLRQAVRKVTAATGDTYLFNTAIAALMTLSNELRRRPRATPGWREARKQLVVMLLPYAPHLAHHVWPLVADAPHEQPRWPELPPQEQ